jgi:hypothetical protein
VGGGGDPVLAWAFGERGLHRLQDRPPYHGRCRCTIEVMIARGERREVSQTTKTAGGPCAECLARERIWRWLAWNGHHGINVARLAEGVEFGGFVGIYSHLKPPVDAYPRALPLKGITLTFDPSSKPQEFGAWDEEKHRMNLAGEWFGNARQLAALRAAMRGFELTGENPRGCNTPENVVTHELGHCLWYRLDTPRYERWWQMANAREMCLRGSDSATESFAEAFSMVGHLSQAQWPASVRVLWGLLREDGVLQ